MIIEKGLFSLPLPLYPLFLSLSLSVLIKRSIYFFKQHTWESVVVTPALASLTDESLTLGPCGRAQCTVGSSPRYIRSVLGW